MCGLNTSETNMIIMKYSTGIMTYNIKHLMCLVYGTLNKGYLSLQHLVHEWNHVKNIAKCMFNRAAPSLKSDITLYLLPG